MPRLQGYCRSDRHLRKIILNGEPLPFVGIAAALDRADGLDEDVTQSLSGLEGDDLAQFQDVWRGLNGDHRLALLGLLRQAADESAFLEFSSVYKGSLDDPDAEVRAAALSLLAEDADLGLLDSFLKSAVTDPSEEVRLAALDGLSHFTYAAQTDGWDPESERKLETALAGVLHLPTTSFPLRRAALLALAYLTTARSEQEIRQAHLQPDLHVTAVEAMGRNCQEIWIDDVITEMEADDPELRQAAAEAAAELEDQRLIPHLLGRLKDDDDAVRRAAIKALGATGGSDAKAALSQLLASRNRDVREAARDAMESLLDDEDPFRAL
ncbi:MAG: hypothetical protein HW416_368 [Chloroflexi bacterium]|nr:hypothetical protein [Chloroflexota bacterium]